MPTRVTPAGEVEPPLPFSSPAAARQLHRFVRREEGLEEGAVDSTVHTTRENIQVTRRTTDQTLAEDLAASLALTGEPPRPAGQDPWIDDAVDHAAAMVEAMDTSGTPEQRLARAIEAEEDAAREHPRGVLGPHAPYPPARITKHPAPSGIVFTEAYYAAELQDAGLVAAPLTYDHPVDLADLPLFAYVSGPAGVGKTFWAKEVARLGGEAVCLAATTGIASVNLGEGTTINAYLRYFDTASLRESYTGGFLEAMLKRHRATGLERILLDEVSMLPDEQLTILTRAIDNVNQDRPEGVPEIGLILLGDFCQLSPVPDRDPRDPKGFKKLPVHFAFESPEWERYEQHTLKLTTIRRQADREFIEALQAIRRGEVGKALGYFGPRMVQTTDMHFPGPTIVAKNDAVGKYNQLRLDAVHGEKRLFPSARWGKVRPEWGAPPKPESEWGVPPTLLLKDGCRVMILANKNVAERDAPPVWAYTNGDLGTFLREEGGVAVVTLDRTGTEVRVGGLQRFNEIPMEPGRRKALKAEGHPERISEDGKKEYIGGITYVPLRLAYATTTHKSQGLSLDQVQVNIRDSFFAQPGMLYVALSRARSAEGLRLVGSPEGFRARCTVNPKLKGYL